MKITSPKHRKAISPVLATVILIAITLIAAIAIAGFVFGLFASFTTTAQVTAGVVSCTASSKQCDVRLQNIGSASATPTSCSIANVAATLNSTVTAITAGGHKFYLCTGTGTYVAGAQAVGSFSLSNGGQVQFSGVWA